MPSRAHAWFIRAGTFALVTVVVALAILQVRGWNGVVNADGVSFLDLGREFSIGDATPVSNGYWSPLYPLLLGVVQAGARLLGIGIGEIPLVFAANVAIFGMAALALARLARALALPAVGDDARVSNTALVVRALAAGALCVWAMLRMITATAITPDALLAVWLFLASADIAEAAASEPSVRRHLRFGTVLSLGYWTKAVFLPVSLVALLAYVLATPASSRRQALTRTLLPLLLIALPLVLVQSWKQGRPSFGETGRINYRWQVARLPHALPVHETVQQTRTRVRHGESAVIALASPPGGALFTGASRGSYPYWYEPSRYEPRDGAPFSLGAQWEMISYNMHWFQVTAGMFALFLLVGGLAAASRGTVRARRLLAMLPAAVMLGLYTLTLPQGRLGGAAIACALLAFVYLSDAPPSGRRRPLLVVECIALLLLSVVALGRTAKRIPSGASEVNAPTPTAASLRAAGVPRGAAIALAGVPFGQFWPHEGDVRIVAVLPQADSLFGSSETALRALMNESAARGVPLDAVIWNGDAVHVPDAVPLAPSWWALRPATQTSTLLHR